ncbi:MAG: hypothetical protein JNJ73_19795 [Hyphomonadaceae bacterium]|nr:hypothetical protein [Hyphomonadaceae bacterium]
MTGAEADLPVVCDLRAFSETELAAHYALSIDVVLRWPTQREDLPNGYLFHYQGGEERFLALARWAGEESRCCRWANYAVELTPAHVSLRMTAPTQEGKDALTTGIEMLETLQHGPLPDFLLHSEGAESLDSFRDKVARHCGCA